MGNRCCGADQSPEDMVIAPTTVGPDDEDAAGRPLFVPNPRRASKLSYRRTSVDNSTFTQYSDLKQRVASGPGEERLDALNKLLELAISTEHRISMASSAVGLLPVLRDVVAEDSGASKETSLGILNNLAGRVFLKLLS